MQFPLISIVVPVYNVEQCLSRCMNSIINQTYKNLEIILVDDGSTDNSGKMCDDIALTDNRIKVIHKKNGGLSDARNAGIDVAKGEYLAFVDSDDYIDLNMYQILIDNITSYNADISTCMRAEVYENEKIIENNLNKKNTPICLTSRDAVKDLFIKNEHVYHASWDKLYKRSLFQKIKFPVGRLYEDAAIMYKLFENSDKIVATKAQLYYYIRRRGSISLCEYNKNRILHQFENRVNAIKDFNDRKDLKMRTCAIVWNLRSVYPLWSEAFDNEKNVADYIYMETKKYFCLNVIKYLSIKQFIKSLIFIINPRIIRLLKGKGYEQ